MRIYSIGNLNQLDDLVTGKGNVGIIISDDQCTLKLTGVTGIDAEVTAQLHRTADALELLGISDMIPITTQGGT